MTRLVIGFILVAATTTVGRPMLAEETGGARKQIEMAYEKLRKATLARTAEAVAECHKEIEADDALFIDSKGDIYPYQALGQRYATFAKTIISYEYSIKKFTMSGNEANVWVEVNEARTEAHRPGTREPQARPHRVVSIQHIKDTWIKTPGGWKRSLREEIAPTDVTVENEQPAPPTTK